MNKLGFFTPVNYSVKKSCINYITEGVENLFSLGGRTAYVIPNETNIVEIRNEAGVRRVPLDHFERSLTRLALKVIAYAIPCIAAAVLAHPSVPIAFTATLLCYKTLFRLLHTFRMRSAEMELFEAVERMDIMSLMQALQQQPLDINVQFSEGKTALHKAVETGQKAMIPELLKAGADPNVQANDGSTPLHLAIEHATHGNDDSDGIFLALLKANASPLLSRNDHATPLHIAVAKNALSHLQVLCQHKDIRAFINNRRYIPVVGLPDEGLSALDFAALRGRYDMVSALTDAGATTYDFFGGYDTIVIAFNLYARLQASSPEVANQYFDIVAHLFAMDYPDLRDAKAKLLGLIITNFFPLNVLSEDDMLQRISMTHFERTMECLDNALQKVVPEIVSTMEAANSMDPEGKGANPPAEKEVAIFRNYSLLPAEVRELVMVQIIRNACIALIQQRKADTTHWWTESKKGDLGALPPELKMYATLITINIEAKHIVELIRKAKNEFKVLPRPWKYPVLTDEQEHS